MWANWDSDGDIDSHRDMKNAAVDLVSYSVNNAPGGVGNIASDATVAKGVGLLVLTVSAANFEIYNEVIIATSGWIWKLVHRYLGGSMEQADVGIDVVSINSVGVLPLISITNG